LTTSSSILSQTSTVAFINLSFAAAVTGKEASSGYVSHILFFRIFHIFSMGLRSGLYGGQSVRKTPFSDAHLVLLDYAGMLSAVNN
jgi:hypothetical protein